ncbi:50S ribosomal protein L21 [Candidatus Beckwithbacteria bacterium]|nr:50S ribosomal protein L21 [Candidatus Beckwithbacteria bacterium]
MDFAIIKTGGKQYKITPDSKLVIEKIDNVKPGEKIIFDQVLLVASGEDVKIGNPYLEGVSIEAILEENFKGEKIRVSRFRAKSRHRRTIGHRQQLTKVSFANLEKPAKKEVKEKKEIKTEKKTSAKK